MAANVFGSLSASAYLSPGTITSSKPSNFTETAPSPFLGGTGVNRNQGTKVYDPTAADGTDLLNDPAPAEEAPAANSPAFWPRGKDFYKNDGMTGQAFFNNSTVPAPDAPAVTGGPATLTDTGSGGPGSVH